MVLILGRKQDVWIAVDPESGQKRRRMSMDGIGKMCPPMGQIDAPLYIGRTGWCLFSFYLAIFT